MSTPNENRRIGPFEIQRKLGEGGMGVVYLATHLETGKQVALKALSPDVSGDAKVVARFAREMEILKKLKHPHIVKYYGGVSTNAQQFYAMELVTGGSLERVLRKKGRISWEEAVNYGIQIAKALEHAHNAGIIHRDLKPANLMITAEGMLKLTDFGIARDTQRTQLTQAGKTVGTMAYMAPEQITGKSPISRRTDLYALGCVLFQMLTGRTPFESATQGEMLFKHIDEPAPSVRELNQEVPVWLDRLINELLEKEPNERPFDALAVQERLKEVRTKVIEQEQLVQKMTDQGITAVTRPDGTVSTKTTQKKKSKKTEVDYHPSFWERTWFQAICLIAIVGLLGWGLWPESADAVLARVEPMMSSDDSDQWFAAESDIKRLITKSAGTHLEAQARSWAEQIELERAWNRFTKRNALGSERESKAEDLLRDAYAVQVKLGDLYTARRKYEAIPGLVKDDSANDIHVRLSKRQAEKLAAETSEDFDPVVYIAKKLEEADALFREGNKSEAETIWQAVNKYYAGEDRFSELVKQAKSRLIDAEADLGDK